jgi:signal transduction histidine kinase/ActR/RegA family two-component response regulator
MWLLATGSFVLVAVLTGLLWRERRAAHHWKQAALQCRASFAVLAEQAREQTTKMDAIINGMPDGIMVLDPGLKLVEWNARFPEFAGVPKELLRTGLDLADILRAQAAAGEFGPVDTEAEVARRLALLRSGGSTGAIERTRPDGGTLELRRSPMSGGGFITLYTDISKRRQAENQLRQAQKMEAVGHLTGGVAHDFNNLLMVVIGNLELAMQALETSDLLRAQRKIETAQGGAQRAAALTKRLLAFARRQSLEPQPVDANQVVSGMSEIIRHSIGGGIQLETVLAGGLWDAVVDPNQLENALLNLAINARDAMPGGGKVTIETANAHLDAAYAARHAEVTPGQYVLVAVSDGGTGMTPEEAARAFEPFYTTKDVGKGSGLGLSQVFGFIKQSNGHVKIYSEPGAGTTVKLYLPRLAAERPSVIETAAPRPALPRARDRECVLVVEDDADVLAISVDQLGTLGYHALGAKDAPSALVALEGRPDVQLLFTDVELPGLNGPELVQEALRRRPDLAVLYTTGYTANAVVHRGILDGEVRSINKPYDFAELAKTVREMLDGKAAKEPRLPGEAGEAP